MFKTNIFKDDNNFLKHIFISDDKTIEMILNIDNSVDKIYIPINHLKSKNIEVKDYLNCLYKTLTKNDIKRTNNNKLIITFNIENISNLNLIEEIIKYENELKEKLNYKLIGYKLSASTNFFENNLKEIKNLIEKYNIPLKLYLYLNTISKESLTNPNYLKNLVNFEKKLKQNDLINKDKKIFKDDNVITLLYLISNNYKEELKNISLFLSKYKLPIRIYYYEKINKEIKNWIKENKNIVVETKILEENKIKNNYIFKHYYEEFDKEEEKEKYEKWKTKHQIFEKERKDYLNWDEYFMAVAKLSAKRSKDPNTQVGATIVSSDNRILSIGYNGTPNGYKDEAFPWMREGDKLQTKYMYVVHAERNAILNYRGHRKDFENSKIYVDLFPCNECAKEIIQSGIKEVIYLSDKYKDTEETIASKRLFDVCGVKYRQLSLENKKIIEIDLKI